MTDLYYTCEKGHRVPMKPGIPTKLPPCVECGKESLRIAKANTADRKAFLQKQFENGKLLSYSEYGELSDNSVSKEEYDRYVYLHDLQGAGVIHNLELQIKYEVLPRLKIKTGVTWYKDFTQSRVTYSPDFRFMWEQLQIVEEYKALNFGTKKRPLKTPRPIIKAASRKSIKELICHDANIRRGKVLFIITAWNKKTGLYEAFNANSNAFDYPLANYVHSEALRPTG